MRLGETILQCEPFAHVVHEDYRGCVCDFCMREGRSLQRCTACHQAFYCGKECQRAAWKDDHRRECRFMKEGGDFSIATARLMAKIIVKQKAGKCKVPVTLPNGSRRSFDDLLSHSKEIVRDSELMFMIHLINADLKIFFKETVPSLEQVIELFGRNRVNSFNISNEDEIIGMGLYLEASVFDHSCIPNAVVAFKGKSLSVRSIVDDANLRFEDVRISYADLMGDTKTRRASLRQNYYFECACVECESDPGGLDKLKQSAMRCPKCQSAVPVADDVISDLKCSKCSESLDAHAFKALKAKVVADVIDNKNCYPQSVLDAKTVRYAEDMFKANFHPYDPVYFRVLSDANVVHGRNEEWPSVLHTLTEAAVAYRGLYPKYTGHTGQILRRVVTQAINLDQHKKAEAYLMEARDIFAVTHGENHPVYKEIIQTLWNVQSMINIGKL